MARYLRLSRAHEELGNAFEAQEALIRGLKTKAVENQFGLADQLLSLQTNGKGLASLNKEEFEAWTNFLVIGDEKLSKLLEGLGGAWKRRLDDYRNLLDV